LVSFTKFIELKVEERLGRKKEVKFVGVIAGYGNGRPRNPGMTPGRRKRYLSLSLALGIYTDCHLEGAGMKRLEFESLASCL